MDFAPVLDVDTNPDNPVIGDRSFSRDQSQVALHGMAFAEGLRKGGCLACGKHFPGHGDTDQDSHLALPSLPHDLARLHEVELLPFRAAAKSFPAFMTAHVVFSALDQDVPATLSRRVLTDLLRHELGFTGVIISDDLEMKAVSRRAWPSKPGRICCSCARTWMGSSSRGRRSRTTPPRTLPSQRGSKTRRHVPSPCAAPIRPSR